MDWIPFSRLAKCARLDDGNLTLLGRTYRLWIDREIPATAKVANWCLSTDARGRWYANFTINMPGSEKREGEAIGIDLGLKSLATLSTGESVEMPAFYRRSEAKLALHQRRKQKRRARSVAAKVANQRRDYLHRVSTRITREFAQIYVGDVQPSAIGKTCMAKSVHDAGWAMLKHMLSYKAIALGGVCEDVSERWTSQTCSDCGSVRGPKGIAGLGIRLWDCPDCGASHDRDVNAARNILRVGAECRPLAEGIAA